MGILKVVPDTAFQVPTGLSTDGLLGRRYAARCIDSIFICVAIVAMVMALGGSPFGVGQPNANMLLETAIALVMWVGYGAAFEASVWQATPGKRMVGLKVYNAQGGRLSLQQATVRSLVKDGPFVVAALLPYGNILVFAWLALHLVVMYRSPVYQAIHDRVAHTLVAAPESTTQLHLA